MKFYKRVKDNYILMIGTNCGGTEITENEYNNILTIVKNKPIPEEGFDYKLKDNLEWEIFKLPEEDEPDAQS